LPNRDRKPGAFYLYAKLSAIVKSFLTSLLTAAVVLYGLATLAMYLWQRSFIYHPSPEIEHPYQQLQIAVDDEVTLQIIEVNPNQPDAVIYFGGNAEAVAAGAADLARALPDKTLYLVNYRGYGGSGGSPTEANLFTDAEKVFDAISSGAGTNSGSNYQSISVIGRSLGSGVACWLASRKPAARLVLITPYDSILKIAQSAFSIFPVSWLLKDRYESVKYAPLIDAPVLALLAERDNIIPASSSEELLRHFPGFVETHVLSGTGHNDLQLHPKFYPAISEFLK
jgi:pimeloyl-ACP methyl ester carboxylesterase